jgi:hypothetical protein
MTPERLADITELTTRHSKDGCDAFCSGVHVGHALDLLAEVDRLAKLTATCTCATTYATYEGPEADCPVHGAVQALNAASAEIAQLAAERDEAQGELARMRSERAEWVRRGAAARIGVSYAEYDAQRAAGQKWCRTCKAWQPIGWFGVDRSRYDGLTPSCRKAVRAALDTLPADHASPNCACGLNGLGQAFIDPICQKVEVSRG